MAKATQITDAPVQAAPLTSGEIAAFITEIQLDRQQKNQPPLTGVELSAQIGAMQPAAAPSGTRYRVTERTAQDQPPAVVTSIDGTIEDAVRAYNNGRVNIRTAKQLIIQSV